MAFFDLDIVHTSCTWSGLLYQLYSLNIWIFVYTQKKWVRRHLERPWEKDHRGPILKRLHGWCVALRSSRSWRFGTQGGRNPLKNKMAVWYLKYCFYTRNLLILISPFRGVPSSGEPLRPVIRLRFLSLFGSCLVWGLGSLLLFGYHPHI